MTTIDDIFRGGAALKNTFTSAELAEHLGATQDDVAKVLKTLSSVGAAVHDKNKWSLIGRRTDVRDQFVANALAAGATSRDKLNERLPDFTPAQVYTSLQRLILRGGAKQSRDGSRTPLYESVSTA